MAEQVRLQELQRAQRAFARGDDPRQILDRLSRAITNKLIHAPTTGLKQASADGRQDLVNSARKLLGLEGNTHPPSPEVERDQPDLDLPASTAEITRRTLQ